MSTEPRTHGAPTQTKRRTYSVKREQLLHAASHGLGVTFSTDGSHRVRRHQAELHIQRRGEVAHAPQVVVHGLRQRRLRRQRTRVVSEAVLDVELHLAGRNGGHRAFQRNALVVHG